MQEVPEDADDVLEAPDEAGHDGDAAPAAVDDMPDLQPSKYRLASPFDVNIRSY
jgi:hypothetical protein